MRIAICEDNIAHAQILSRYIRVRSATTKT